MLHLYDTAAGKTVAIEGRVPGQVSMYVCGPTVYSEPHVGHGRFALVWDLLRRYLRWGGTEVVYVSNITDVDDKIIARAEAEERSPGEVASHWEQVWWDAMDGLGVGRPDRAPRATDYVEEMVELISGLVGAGSAYLGGDGVYFAAESVPDYGLLAHQPLESLRAGARVEVSQAAGKRSPMDFVLWKAAKPGEPTWDSPWGPGRPGWHTECVVMSLDLLGEGFDLHGGGIDLAFPHHENERAQAEAAGRRFARHWVHSAMVTAGGGEKMSKSLGNTLSLPELIEAYDPRALRMLVLQSHYRSPMTVSAATLEAAARAVEGLDTFAREFPSAGVAGASDRARLLERFVQRMDDDLDTPGAVAVLFGLMREARNGAGESARTLACAVIDAWREALGVTIRSQASTVPADAAATAAERDRARRAKDWARADALRDELVAQGWVVEDGPGGTTIRR